MSLDLQVDFDLKNVGSFLDEFEKKALPTSVRKSMNRSVSSLKTHTAREIRKRRRLKVGEIKREFMSVTKAKGNRLRQMNAELGISGRPVSLIRFVRGSKSPRPQRGIAVRKRKRLTVEVTPGQRVKLRSAFIARGRGDKNHVFRRRSKKRTPIVKQSTPALSVLFQKDRILARRTREFASDRFHVEFDRTFHFELDRLIKKRAKRGK